MPSPTISVIIVTHNSADSIERCLASLTAAMDDLTYEVVVVDNGSADGTADLVARLPNPPVLLRSANVGYAAGINAGVALAAGEFFLILNPDTECELRAIPPLLAALREPCTGVAVPQLLDADGSWTPSLRREPTIRRALGLTRTRLPVFSEYVQEREAYVKSTTCDWAVGAALLVSRRCHEAVGGWDESYFLYSEETEFCRRARDLGLVVRFTPSSRIRHVGGGSGRNAWTHSIQVVNRVRYYARRHRLPLTLAYYALNVGGEAVRGLRGNGESRAATIALLRPRSRPTELGLPSAVIPR
ncbi:MAG: glycosyltransferase family 2 protein [Flavobacteriales bacterium]